MDASLEVKITALVEGLKQVADLGTEFVKTASEIEKIGKVPDPFATLGKTATKAGAEVEKAFSQMGGRGAKTVAEEIERVNLALLKVQGTAGVSMADLQRASELAAARVKELNRELSNPAPRSFGDRMKDIADKLKAADFKGAISDVNGLTEGLGGMVGIAAKGAVAFGVYKTITFFKDLLGDVVAYGREAAKTAARNETLGVVLQQVGRNAGYSSASLNDAEKAVRSMGITVEAARDSLAKMIQAGMDINKVTNQVDEKATKMNGFLTYMTQAQALARGAQDLAVVTGENSSQTLQRLIINIQQMDTMGLRFMGLTVQRESAQSKYAATLGKTSEQLTDQERKTAFLIATNVEMIKMQGTYEAAMDTAGKKAASLKRYQDDLADSIGKLLLPAYGAIIDAQTAYYKQADEGASSFAKNTQSTKDFGESLKNLAVPIGSLGGEAVSHGLMIWEAFVRVFKAVSDLAAPVIKGFSDVIQVVNELGKKWLGLDNMAARLNPVVWVLDTIALGFAVISDAVTITFGLVEVLAGLLVTLVGKAVEWAGAVQSFFTPWRKGLTEASKEIKLIGQGMAEHGEKTATAVLKGEGAIGKFVTGLGSANTALETGKPIVTAYGLAIEAIAKAQKGGALQGGALANALMDVLNGMEAAKAAGTLTEAEFLALGKQMASTGASLGTAWDEAMKRAGTSLTELRSGLTKGVVDGLGALTLLGDAAVTKSAAAFEAMSTDSQRVSGDIVRLALSLLDKTKSIADVEAIGGALSKQFAQGSISLTEYNQLLTSTGEKFHKLFTEQLKTASTTQEFQRLSITLVKLRDEGTITGRVFTASMKAISERATGAEAAVKRLSDETKTLSEVGLKVGQAHLGMVKAEIDVSKSRVDLWVAQNKYAMTGNEIDRVGVEIAELDLKIARQELDLKRLQYKEELAQFALAKANQKELNALARLQHASPQQREALDNALADAKEEVKQQGLLVEGLQAEVNLKTEANLRTQETAAITRGNQDILKAEEAEGRRIREFNQSILGGGGGGGGGGSLGDKPRDRAPSGGGGGGGNIYGGGGGGGGGGTQRRWPTIGTQDYRSARERSMAQVDSAGHTQGQIDFLKGQGPNLDASFNFRTRERLQAGDKFGPEDVKALQAGLKASQDNARLSAYSSVPDTGTMRDDAQWVNVFRRALEQATSAPLGGSDEDWGMIVDPKTGLRRPSDERLLRDGGPGTAGYAKPLTQQDPGFNLSGRSGAGETVGNEWWRNITPAQMADRVAAETARLANDAGTGSAGPAVQSIAPVKPSTAAPSKIIQVDLTAEGRKVALTMAAEQESVLLAMLRQFEIAAKST